MPFQYFKKHRKEKAVKKHLAKFQDDLNDLQKKAIMRSLFQIANGDGEYHHKEHEFIVQTAELLNFPLANSSRKIATELLEMNTSEVINQLNSLDAEHKDWYLITAFGMIHSDEKALEEEFIVLKDIFHQMGINQSHFETIIEQTSLFK